MGFVRSYIGNLGGMALGLEPSRPLLFSWYVTHRCDLNCRYCSDGDGKRFREDPIPELETVRAKRLVSILREAGDTLDVTGGEPLLRPDIEEILAHARAVGFRTVLNTKGPGLESRPQVLRHTSVLVLSVDSLDAASLARKIGRPLDKAEEILRALRFALEACRSSGTKLVLAAVATPGDPGDVSEVMRFALDRSLSFQVSPQIVGTRPDPLLRESTAYRGLIDSILEAKRSRRGILGVPEYLLGIRDFRPFRCHPLLMPTIRPDGRMYYPCLEWKEAEVDILEAGSYARALRAARRRFGEVPPCRDCCHIFCHMALSLLQSHPLSALGELGHWRARTADS